MRVAVFGASGFVGINVINALSGAGIEVIASDLNEKKFENVEFRNADLLDYDQVASVVKEADTVIHLAASPLTTSLEKPRLNARINIEGTLNIMDAAREFGCKKLIFSSASSLIGDVKYNPVDEIHPCVPKTPYAVSKYAIEQYLRVYQELYNLDYLIFRFFNVYGPWQFPESKAIIPMVYQKLKNDGSFTVFGDGTQTRDFIYVGDIADFFVKAMKNDVKNEIINMGTGKSITIKDVVETGGEILKIKPKINYLPARPGEIGNFVADTTKVKKLFGEIPGTPLKSGLEYTFRWLDQQ
jgi:UDP-glucose 4-epimerase